jgi:hypothetical protein
MQGGQIDKESKSGLSIDAVWAPKCSIGEFKRWDYSSTFAEF